MPDAPPTVLIEKPSGTLLVTPNARVPLRASAKDDLALRRVDMLLSRSDRPKQPDSVLPLYDGPERVEPQNNGLEQAEQGDRRVVTLDWDLAPAGADPGHPAHSSRRRRRLPAADRHQRAAAAERGHPRGVDRADRLAPGPSFWPN